LDSDDVRVVAGLDFSTRFTDTARFKRAEIRFARWAARIMVGAVFSLELGFFPLTVACHCQYNGGRLFAHTFCTCEEKSVRESPVFKEGS
jgi:hypothetical protein